MKCAIKPEQEELFKKAVDELGESDAYQLFTNDIKTGAKTTYESIKAYKRNQDDTPAISNISTMVSFITGRNINRDREARLEITRQYILKTALANNGVFKTYNTDYKIDNIKDYNNLELNENLRSDIKSQIDDQIDKIAKVLFKEETEKGNTIRDEIVDYFNEKIDYESLSNVTKHWMSYLMNDNLHKRAGFSYYRLSDIAKINPKFSQISAYAGPEDRKSTRLNSSHRT